MKKGKPIDERFISYAGVAHPHKFIKKIRSCYTYSIKDLIKKGLVFHFVSVGPVDKTTGEDEIKTFGLSPFIDSQHKGIFVLDLDQAESEWKDYHKLFPEMKGIPRHVLSWLFLIVSKLSYMGAKDEIYDKKVEARCIFREMIYPDEKPPILERHFFFIPSAFPLLSHDSVLTGYIKQYHHIIEKTLNHKKGMKKSRTPITRQLRHEVFKRDDYKCLECGASNKKRTLHIDHIVPVSRGGTDELENLQTLCEQCNLSKANRAWVSVKKEHKRMRG